MQKSKFSSVRIMRSTISNGDFELKFASPVEASMVQKSANSNKTQKKLKPINSETMSEIELITSTEYSPDQDHTPKDSMCQNEKGTQVNLQSLMKEIEN